MAGVLSSVQFLIGVYWPFLAVVAAVGLVTGWLSLSGKQGEGTR
ncbi:hypothetical protein [Devosia sp. CAU 1758]